MKRFVNATATTDAFGRHRDPQGGPRDQYSSPRACYIVGALQSGLFYWSEFRHLGERKKVAMVKASRRAMKISWALLVGPILWEIFTVHVTPQVLQISAGLRRNTLDAAIHLPLERSFVAKEIIPVLGQHFLDARLEEPATGSADRFPRFGSGLPDEPLGPILLPTAYIIERFVEVELVRQLGSGVVEEVVDEVFEPNDAVLEVDHRSLDLLLEDLLRAPRILLEGDRGFRAVVIAQDFDIALDRRLELRSIRADAMASTAPDVFASARHLGELESDVEFCERDGDGAILARIRQGMDEDRIEELAQESEGSFRAGFRTLVYKIPIMSHRGRDGLVENEVTHRHEELRSRSRRAELLVRDAADVLESCEPADREPVQNALVVVHNGREEAEADREKAGVEIRLARIGEPLEIE
ncbi:hypothetical protein BDK51DRAFT_48233 [Blyttiomyces helicus]|uniref:Uncharacterized protein n=1 Tax=Blyttiomyces helicus TaxID=388810 RepID=A0A4P9WAJ8_9FUNG|nr:hypothetical protein BDK51DRAFT_48233 [Blyttiomyces helicus]|eukprot:RKO89242.1 hypothetical protein BDK51DRAFT_48233 [Blyttiomyces helicus]